MFMTLFHGIALTPPTHLLLHGASVVHAAWLAVSKSQLNEPWFDSQFLKRPHFAETRTVDRGMPGDNIRNSKREPSKK